MKPDKNYGVGQTIKALRRMRGMTQDLQLIIGSICKSPFLAGPVNDLLAYISMANTKAKEEGRQEEFSKGHAAVQGYIREREEQRKRAEKAEAELKAIAERQAAGLAKLQLLHVGKRGLLLVGQNPVAGAPNYVRYSEVAAMLLPSQQGPVEETANTTDTEQLPCPFCDSSNISSGEVLTEINANNYAQSECQGCGALGPRAWLAPGEVDYGDVKAVAAWNRRALLSPAQQEPAIIMNKVVAGYEGGLMVSDPDGGGTITLHYKSVEEAESAFDELTKAFDKVIKNDK